MTADHIYILVDLSSNHVVSQGIGMAHFEDAMPKPPRNIIILSGPDDLGEFDDFSRFEIIRGEKQVSDFLDREASLEFPDAKWIDYTSQELFHQLTPGEIAELLYMAHMNKHWRSPFFYKLHNNYVFLPIENQLLKVYYRQISEFYYQLALLIQDKTAALLNDRKHFFSFRSVPVQEVTLPSKDVLSSLAEIMPEGLILDFSILKYQSDNEVYIPVYLAEDNYTDHVQSIDPDKLLAKLVYNTKEQSWTYKEIKTISFGGYA